MWESLFVVSKNSMCNLWLRPNYIVVFRYTYTNNCCMLTGFIFKHPLTWAFQVVDWFYYSMVFNPGNLIISNVLWLLMFFGLVVARGRSHFTTNTSEDALQNGTTPCSLVKQTWPHSANNVKANTTVVFQKVSKSKYSCCCYFLVKMSLRVCARFFRGSAVVCSRLVSAQQETTPCFLRQGQCFNNYTALKYSVYSTV